MDNNKIKVNIMKKLGAQEELTIEEKQKIDSTIIKKENNSNKKKKVTSKKTKKLNKKLQKAKKAKKDEFYTQLSDIEKELKHYKKHFKNKVVYCNCDDPTISNFFKYFCLNFKELRLKKLITTCYKNQDRDNFSKNDKNEAIYLEYNGTKNRNGIPDFDRDIIVKKLKGDKKYEGGDFRSKECIKLLKQADIVVTNPPFSLFREYIEQLIKYEKKFVIIGNKNAISYKETFNLIKKDKIWTGYRGFSGGMWFYVTAESKNYDRIVDGKKLKNVPSIWFTNLDIEKRHEELIIYKKYDAKDYPKYDNYNAIEVSKTKDIPKDYDGVMGVPITFLDKYNPDQFEILGMDDHRIKYPKWRGRGPDLNGKPIYRRVIIKRR